MNKKNLRGPKKNKSFSEYAQRHRFRIKTQLKDKCYSILCFMGEYDSIATKENAMSEKGNYVLAIIKTKETYDNLKESLSDIKTEMAQLNEIEVDNVKYKIEYFIGGDWKFQACICSLGAANQDYA
ncbi:unnamed protein product [Pocillopora meandrina]|uniref:Uncharacterized protein n=1 Tax=Pocillopora meandrina TaxID=46732 RepID=A0AAU9VM34_9CNID|nr:unnamed protein product [Pocillopora meandrina]